MKKDKNGEDYFVNEDGVRMRKNKKGEWEAYDDEDGFILAKDPKTGKYQKFD